MAAIVLALVEDLIFQAKIRETAKALGVTVATGSLQDGLSAVAVAHPQAVFVDLTPGRPAVDWIRAVKSNPATCSIRIVGFVSHVREDVISSSRTAGCDMVLARSAFTQQLPELLKSLVTECKMDA